MYITEQELSGFDTYKLFPRWLAPNVMTFGGFVLLILQYILLWYFDPTYYASTADIAYPPIPTWVWWFSLFAQFFSHTLDGCDGKQARRTGTSSPLGELFDHGIDSWCVSLFTLNILSVFGRDLAPVSLMYSVQCMTLMTFLLSHWEKYNTGILFLPWAYDLSQVLMAIVYFITAVSGVGVWRGTLLGYEVTILFKVVLYVATFGFAVPMCLYNIYIANKNGTGKNLTFYEGSLPLLSPLLSFTILTTWIYISPSKVLSTNPRIFMLIISVLFSNILCRLIVSQMSNTRCQVFNKFVFFIGAGFACTLYFNNPVIENYILLTLAIGLTVAHIHYAITVVNKLAAHFGIKVFSIKQDSD